MRRDPHSMLDAVIIMDCRGLVDPKNKPFGRILPLEIQIKIMFWVHCFYTMEKRKKVVQEFKGLPKCSLTYLPQHLGEDRWWNQVVVRLQAPRRNGCHHCHRMMDHRLSVSDEDPPFSFFFLMTWMLRHVFFCFLDWHDGGDGPCPSQSGQSHERGDCFCHQPVYPSDPPVSHWAASRDDWPEEAFVRYLGQSDEETGLDH